MAFLTASGFAAPGDGEPDTRPSQPSSVAELVKQRIEAAAEARDQAERMYRAGLGDFRQVIHWSERMAMARLDAAATRDERVAILREYVDQAKKWERLAEQGNAHGVRCSRLDVLGAAYDRIDAELRLAREQEK